MSWDAKDKGAEGMLPPKLKPPPPTHTHTPTKKKQQNRGPNMSADGYFELLTQECQHET